MGEGGCVCVFMGGGGSNNNQQYRTDKNAHKKKNTVLNCHCTETPHRLPTSCTVEDT